MGFLADKTVFSPLTKEILEESISFSCGNEDLDGFFHNDAVSYADNLFGKSYCYYLEESKADIVCAFTVSNASIFTKYLPNAKKKKVGKHVPHIKQDLIYPAVLIGRLGIAVYSLLLIVYSLQLISWLFADDLQNSCFFLGSFEEKAYFCGRSVKYRRN